jgi:hypothetical protein
VNQVVESAYSKNDLSAQHVADINRDSSHLPNCSREISELACLSSKAQCSRNDNSRFWLNHYHIHPRGGSKWQKRHSVGRKEPKAGNMGGSRDPHIIVIVLDLQTVRSRVRVKFRPAQIDRLAPYRYNQ